MRTSNSKGERPIRIVHSNKSNKWRTLLLVGILAAIVVVFLLLGGFDWIPFPEDAGPEELTSYERNTLIEEVDFQCHAAVTSVFPVSAENPGWKWGFLRGGQAFVVFDIVGDLDLCVWAKDYSLTYDESANALTVHIDRVDARRPRVDYNPREIDGLVYTTGQLASLNEEKLADANIDRVWWEAARNTFRGDDTTYVDEMSDMLYRFGSNSLLDSSCFDEALNVVKKGIIRHFTRQTRTLGLGKVDIVVMMPDQLDVSHQPEPIDLGDTVVKKVLDESCHVNAWPLNG